MSSDEFICSIYSLCESVCVSLICNVLQMTDLHMKHEYLVKREPVVIYSNFGFLCTRKHIKDRHGQIRSDTHWYHQKQYCYHVHVDIVQPANLLTLRLLL